MDTKSDCEVLVDAEGPVDMMVCTREGRDIVGDE
jgi:hypothetical protein